MSLTLRPMSIDDYDHVRRLWETCENIGLSGADSLVGITKFLQRNSGLSFVAIDDEDQMIGVVLCGHDGRRGYIHHLAVRHDHRRQGVGRILIDRCLARLRDEDISKCHLFIYHENEPGTAFWNRSGWHMRPELKMMSKLLLDES